MGVQRLQTYIQQHDIGRCISLKEVGQKGYKIIVDGDSVSFYLHETANLPTIFGGEYYDFFRYVDQFFSRLITAGIQLLVVYDGIPPEEKRGTIQERRRTKCQHSVALWDTMDSSTPHDAIVPITRPGLIRNVMLEVLRKYNITVIHSECENDDLIVSIAHDEDFDAV